MPLSTAAFRIPSQEPVPVTDTPSLVFWVNWAYRIRTRKPPRSVVRWPALFASYLTLNNE